jgi:ATP-dependent Clp protease ATP-binding subunit ClpA
VAKRLQQKNITLTFTENAKDLLAERGYDPVFGARPLKRAIQDLLLDELSLRIIEGTVHEGESITVDEKDDQLLLAQAEKKSGKKKP